MKKNSSFESKLNSEYWNSRYLNKDTGWDIQQVSAPLKRYFDQLGNPDKSILIPGCGNAHEAVYLFDLGFYNITLVDISSVLVRSLKEKLKDTSIQILCEDIFVHQGQYDLIIEQTLFCAIDPFLRSHYVTKMHSLLNKNGKLVGVLFNKDFEKPGPPFGGNEKEYRSLFGPYFTFKTFETCDHSIEPRKNQELFINFLKK